MNESLHSGIHWPHTTATGRPVLRTMVVCDLCDSTAMVERLGDRRAAGLMRKHDRLTRALIDEHDGREIDKTDGYLLLFERPGQAVSFALAYQRGLQFMSEAEEMPVRARVGIHIGDVVMWENTPEDIARGAKPMEVEGLAKPIAARLASLARPRQILLSGIAASIARRGEEELEDSWPEAQWHDHGSYRLKGVAEPMEILQIGEADTADFRTPSNRAAGHRILPWWQRTSTLSAAAVVLALAIGLSTWLIMRQPPHIPFGARDWVVIADVDNRTGQTEFNRTIDTAIRLGLQQSRFVNVISPTKMRQTLARMKRPEDTPVHLKLGSDIALRDGAKALIIPSISNAGNDYHISASLVDPRKQRVIKKISVSAESQEKIIPSISRLVDKIRNDLGESLAQIKSTSVPLEQVTTTNMEALRAYSLALQASAKGNDNLAVDLLKHALTLDNRFASAWATLAAEYLVLGNKVEARHAINIALKHTDRLTPFERIKLHAEWVTIYKTRSEALDAWKVVSDLYPDDPASANNTGLYYAGYANDCKSALPYLKHAASIPQSYRPTSIYILATCQLSMGLTKEAINNFKYSYDHGFRGPFLGLSEAYVENRQYDKASDFLAGVPNDPNNTISLAIQKALIRSDQGDLSGAESILLHTLASINDPYDAKAWPIRIDLISILWAEGKIHAARSRIRNDLEHLISLDDKGHNEVSVDYSTLLALYSSWSARLGEINLARQAIEVATKNNKLRGNPVRSQLIYAAQAEIALKLGNSKEALDLSLSANNHPLWEIIYIIAQSKAANDSPDSDKAFAHAIAARSLAFGELLENQLGIISRSVLWNISFIDAAKNLELKNKTKASEYASLFLDHWKMAPRNNPFIKEAQEIISKR